MMHSFFGTRFIESPLMVNREHVGTQLNGYRGSKNRSKRIWKKLIKGTRKKAPWITPIIETTPKTEVYQLATGEIVGHPMVIAQLRRETSSQAARLGMPSW